MNRRGFLFLVAGLAATVALGSPFSPLAWRLFGTGDARTAALAARLRAALLAQGLQPASAFASRGAAPAEVAAQAVAFVGDASLREVDALCTDPAALAAHVAARRRADLAAGRTRYVDGWLLAETEVQVGVLLGADVRP